MKNTAKRNSRTWVERSHEQSKCQMIGEVSFLQGSQNLTYKEMSIVFVICYGTLLPDDVIVDL